MVYVFSRTLFAQNATVAWKKRAGWSGRLGLPLKASALEHTRLMRVSIVLRQGM